jgi:hypothetical protein
MKWQKIETAPFNSRFLAWNEVWGGIWIVHTYLYPKNYFVDSVDSGCHYQPPTHWMPLPEPPVEEA